MDALLYNCKCCNTCTEGRTEKLLQYLSKYCWFISCTFSVCNERRHESGKFVGMLEEASDSGS